MLSDSMFTSPTRGSAVNIPRATHSYAHTWPSAVGSSSLDVMQCLRAVDTQADEVFLGLLPTAGSQSLWHLERTRDRYLETTA